MPVTNGLMDRMPGKERARFLARCEPTQLVFGTILCESDQRYRQVYFPVTGFISLVAAVDDHPPLEMGLIGNEGMLGVTLVLGVDKAHLRAVVQGSGSAWRMTARQFQLGIDESPALARALDRYLYVLMAQLAQNAACLRFHEVEARLARWLLMTHDRAHADHFHLTHKFLADMLGVRRSAVTIAAGELQKRRLIHYARGEISVLHRRGLEARACECYAAVRGDYTQRFTAPA